MLKRELLFAEAESTGKVGIGTSTPDAKLDVNGGIIAGGKTTYTLDPMLH